MAMAWGGTGGRGSKEDKEDEADEDEAVGSVAEPSLPEIVPAVVEVAVGAGVPTTGDGVEDGEDGGERLRFLGKVVDMLAAVGVGTEGRTDEEDDEEEGSDVAERVGVPWMGPVLVGGYRKEGVRK